MSGGEKAAEVLARRGVKQLFTLCGGHVSPILVAAERLGIRVVDVRDEATAVFAADAIGRLGKVPGVAVVTAGPGVTNSATALQNATLAQSPLVVIGGATATLLRGRGALQDIDQIAAVRPLVKRTSAATRVCDVAPCLEAAFDDAARGVPGPVFVELPVDLLYPEEIVRSWYVAKSGQPPRSVRERLERWYVGRHLERLLAPARARSRPVSPPLEGSADTAGAPLAADAAARLLAGAGRPVVLAGGPVADPARISETAAALERLGAPVYLSGMARGMLGRSHPLQLRHHRKEALREADFVLLLGVPCDFRLDYGRQIARDARVVSVNRRGADRTRNRRFTLRVDAPPADFLRALGWKADAARPVWSAALRARDAGKDAAIAAAPAGERGALDPVAFCRTLEEELPEDAVLVADGGDFVATASYVVRPRAPLTWLDPGVFGTLGVGAGFGMGAALARPNKLVVAIFGDGAFGFSLAEIDTFARHRIPFVAIIGNDGGWSQIAREQVEILGSATATMLARTSYERAAAGLGARAFLIDDPTWTAAVLQEAFAAARTGAPAVVNVMLGKSAFRKGSISI